MERYSDKAIEILNELHTERLDYESEYLPLIDCANQCAAYEDTHLTPEQVAGAITLNDFLVDYGVPIDHLRKLVEAENNGRLVALPCNVGCEVWTNLAMSGWYLRDKDRPYAARVVFVGLNNSDKMGGGLLNVVYGKGDHMMQFDFSDIGKTVFLTREEAEAALKIV